MYRILSRIGKLNNLSSIARDIRTDIIRMSYEAQSAHMGGSLSCVELLTALYFSCMNIDPKKPDDPDSDKFIFSKAHDAKALYATLCKRGYFSPDLLKGYEKNNGKLPGHATRHCVPGVEISAGSLGHGLPMAVGMAFAAKMNSNKKRIFCMISDGECDEGTTWEAALFAGHHKLDNLTLIIDYNKLQGFGTTKDILDIEPLSSKWQSFNWTARNINGHTFDEIIEAVNKPSGKDKPMVIIARTIKGKDGPEQHVNSVSSQYKPPTTEEYEKYIR